MQFGAGQPSVCYSAPPEFCPGHTIHFVPLFNFSYSSPQTALLGWRVRCLDCTPVSALCPISIRGLPCLPLHHPPSLLIFASLSRRCHLNCWIAFLRLLRGLSISFHLYYCFGPPFPCSAFVSFLSVCVFVLVCKNSLYI